jgi:hypothetical protein
VVVAGDGRRNLAALVGWWQANVSVRHAGDTKNADLRSCLKLSDAEALTGFTKVQVSASAADSRTVTRNLPSVRWVIRMCAMLVEARLFSA